MSVRIRRGGALGAVSINSNSLNPVQNGLLFDLSAKYYGIAESGISTSVWPDLTENHRDFRFQSANGVDENSPSYSSTNLEFDFETTYDANAGDFILIEDDTWIPEDSSARTLEVYVKLNSFRTGDFGTTRWNFLLSKTTTSNQSFSFGFGERDGTVFYGCGAQGVLVPPGSNYSAFTDEEDRAVLINPDNYLNKYLHCVLTYDYPTAILYIDGVEQYRNSGNKVFGDNTAPLRGMTFDPNNSTYYWPVDGQLRTVRMYDRALSTDEITKNLNSLRAQYKVDPSSYATVTQSIDCAENTFHIDAEQGASYAGISTDKWYDISPTEVTDAALNGPTFVDEFGGYFSFDGTDDYVDYGTNAVFSFAESGAPPGEGEFTIDIWFRRNGSTEVNDALISLSDTVSDNSYQIEFSGSEIFRFVGDSSTVVVSSVTAIPDLTWTHACFVKEGSGADQMKLYINGNLRDTGQHNYNLNLSGPLEIGRNRGATKYFSGDIAAVRQYKGRAFTAAEVLRNYNAQKSRFGL